MSQDGPAPIRQLHESLINRIAAGEIIHRPSSALKELLENSLDAGSTSIRVTIKDGGLKLLQIQDNGCGIRKEDLPILAERFTTSKLSTYSDLSRLKTYGFRGEALASISHVSHLSVITKTKKDTCAWKANYMDGKLASPKPGLTADPKPCAGNDGTTITAEDLFYNTPTRLSALRSSSEEYSRILDVITRYAIHNPKVSFQCKKAGSPHPDVSTPSNSTVEQTIRLMYGGTIAKDLLRIKFTSGGQEDADVMEVDEDIEVDESKWKAEAFCTSANYHAKKFAFLLFINHRLVESSRIKRAIEAVYSSILPKGTSPFVYLSLEIDPRAVDVNVHPTKREVHFLEEEKIVQSVADAIQEALAGHGAGGKRTFECMTQTLLTGAVIQETVSQNRKQKGTARERSNENSEEGSDDEVGSENRGSASKQAAHVAKKMYSKDKVRTNRHDRTLDSMFPVLAASDSSSPSTGKDREATRGSQDGDSNDRSKYRDGSNTAVDADDSQANSSSTSRPQSQPMLTQTHAKIARTREIKESECYLTSVVQLRKLVTKDKHSLLTEIVQSHTFVGIVDLERSLSLLQYSTKLYLVNHAAIAEELFYQLGLRQFGNFHRLKLEPPPSVKTLIRLAVRAEDGRWKEFGVDLDEDTVVERITKTLSSRADMLDEYFSLKINGQGQLESLPLLMGDYTPNLDKLPLFLMRLGPQVDWNAEKECFASFLRELAYFYSPCPLPNPAQGHSDTGERRERWQIEHSLFPCMRKYLIPPKSLLDRDVVQVASLPDLYRVFERC